jgi:hypothetical protein
MPSKDAPLAAHHREHRLDPGRRSALRGSQGTPQAARSPARASSSRARACGEPTLRGASPRRSTDTARTDSARPGDEAAGRRTSGTRSLRPSPSRADALSASFPPQGAPRRPSLLRPTDDQEGAPLGAVTQRCDLPGFGPRLVQRLDPREAAERGLPGSSTWSAGSTPNATPRGPAKRPAPTPISRPRPSQGSRARTASHSGTWAARCRSNHRS